MAARQAISATLVNGGRKLSLSPVIGAGDVAFLNGKISFRDAQVMTTARPAVVSGRLVDVRVEVEVIAWRPEMTSQ